MLARKLLILAIVVALALPPAGRRQYLLAARPQPHLDFRDRRPRAQPRDRGDGPDRARASRADGRGRVQRGPAHGEVSPALVGGAARRARGGCARGYRARAAVDAHQGPLPGDHDARVERDLPARRPEPGRRDGWPDGVARHPDDLAALARRGPRRPGLPAAVGHHGARVHRRRDDLPPPPRARECGRSGTTSSLRNRWVSTRVPSRYAPSSCAPRSGRWRVPSMC